MTGRPIQVARALLTMGLLVAPIGVRAARADAAAELRTLEQNWLRAAGSRDTAALDRILAAGFVHVAYDGRVLSKADAMKASVAPPTDRQTLSQLTVHLYGGTGVVTGLNTVASPGGAVEVRLRFTDVFVHLDGRWQAVSAQETPERFPR